MNVLREQLRSQSPELHAALERSWEVAFDEWLPAVSPNNDSFNSYPHIRNLENYLAKLLVAYERRQAEPPLLTPLELYVLLVCILLHDIGKAGDRSRARDGDRESQHDRRSKRIINANWAHLGIPTLGLALSVAKICGVHDTVADDMKKELSSLSTIVVDPFGQIRERELAAILVLIDHMDATCLRIVADYLKRDDFEAFSPPGQIPKKPPGQIPNKPPILGAFRKKIRGVDIDLDGGLVKVVLGEEWNLPGEDAHATIEWDIPSEEAKADPEQLTPPTEDDLRRLSQQFGHTDSPDLVATIARESQLASRPMEGSGTAQRTPRGITHKEVEYVFLKQPKARLLPLAPSTENAPTRPVPVRRDRLLLHLLMKDTYNNDCILQCVSDILSAIGLPLRGWRIEYKEHLFEWDGRESYEPVLTPDRMKEALEKAWKLTTEIFAAGKLGYATLAAELGEPSPQNVRMALRRLNVIASGTKHIDRPFWLSDNEWCWAAPRLVDLQIPHGHQKCPFKSSGTQGGAPGFPQDGGSGCEKSRFFSQHERSIDSYRKLCAHVGQMGSATHEGEQ